MTEQPTYALLRAAFSDAIECAEIIGAGFEKRVALKALRDQKTTWVGKEENDLRFAIDRFLRGAPV